MPTKRNPFIAHRFDEKGKVIDRIELSVRRVRAQRKLKKIQKAGENWHLIEPEPRGHKVQILPSL